MLREDSKLTTTLMSLLKLLKFISSRSKADTRYQIEFYYVDIYFFNIKVASLERQDIRPLQWPARLLSVTPMKQLISLRKHGG